MTEVPLVTTWGPVRWDATLAGLEGCLRELREAGAPADGVVAVSYTSYLSRQVTVRPAPPERRAPPPPTAEELAQRQRHGRQAARGRP